MFDMQAIVANKNNLKVRDFQADLRNELAKRMLQWALGLGLQEPPTKDETKIIEQFIFNNYKDFTMPEIMLAFQYALVGKLKLEKSEIKHYQAFSILYVSTILNAYREYRTEELKKEQSSKPQLPEKTELSDQEKGTIAYNSALQAFEEFKKKGEYEDFGNCTYKYLEKLNVIDFDKNRKWSFVKKAKENLNNYYNPINANGETQTEQYKKIIRDIESNGKDAEGMIIIEAKKEAVRVFFKELIEMGEELKTLLDEKINNIG